MGTAVDLATTRVGSGAMETKERNPFIETMDHIAVRRAECAHRELKLETHHSYLTGFYICQECGERLLTR